jgi:hypothetical protein
LVDRRRFLGERPTHQGLGRGEAERLERVAEQLPVREVRMSRLNVIAPVEAVGTTTLAR